MVSGGIISKELSDERGKNVVKSLYLQNFKELIEEWFVRTCYMSQCSLL